MDTITLVDEQVRDGEVLLEMLDREGVAVRVAGWVKPVDEDRWSLYLATPLIDKQGPISAYREVYRILRTVKGGLLKEHEVKLVGEQHRVAKDLIEAQANPHRAYQPLTSVGGNPVEDLFVYPPRAKSLGPKQSVLRFVLRSLEDFRTIVNRFQPNGMTALNSTVWRGKEPRSCGVHKISGRSYALGSVDPKVYDIEVAYRPKGTVTFTGGTKYDGWTAIVLNRGTDGSFLDDNGMPLQKGHPPVYRRVDPYSVIDFNQIDFGEFVGESEVEVVKHVLHDDVMLRMSKSKRFSASIRSAFVAPRRNRPLVKFILTNQASSRRVDGFGTHIVAINKSADYLQLVLLDHLTELVNGFIEGRYSIKNLSNDDLVLVELDDVLVDCTPNEDGKDSLFGCLRDYLPSTYLEELALRLAATYEVEVSVVDGPHLALLLRRL